MFVQYSIITTNYTHPVKKNIVYLPFALEGVRTKQMQLVLSKQQLVTDEGWVLSSNTHLNVTTHDHLYVDSGPIIGNTVLNCMIYNNGDLEITNRRYLKAQEFLAQFNGMVAWTILIMSIIISKYTKSSMQMNLANDLYDLKIRRKDFTEEDFLNIEKNRAKKREAY